MNKSFKDQNLLIALLAHKINETFSKKEIAILQQSLKLLMCNLDYCSTFSTDSQVTNNKKKT